jgi:hypothetical protein
MSCEEREEVNVLCWQFATGCFAAALALAGSGLKDPSTIIAMIGLGCVLWTTLKIPAWRQRRLCDRIRAISRESRKADSINVYAPVSGWARAAETSESRVRAAIEFLAERNLATRGSGDTYRID